MNNKVQAVLLAERNIHTSVFCSLLSGNSGLDVSHVSSDSDWQHLFLHPDKSEVKGEILLIIDLGNPPRITYNKMINDANKWFSHWACVLVNVPVKLINKDLVLKWPSCRGIFKKNISRLELAAGLKRILDGEYWLPRGIMAELLDHYRSENSTDITKHPDELPSLTSREEDILKLLTTGISNAEMAETLFVSENTIKSHLYKMFKKINVKNRTQARSWAKENMC